MNSNRQAQPLLRETPAPDAVLRERAPREPDPLTGLLQEINADARGLAESYPQDTRVPEGGE